MESSAASRPEDYARRLMTVAPLLRKTLMAVAFAIGISTAVPSEPEPDNIFKALNDELQRSMTLRLEDLDRPYFIQYAVDDTVVEQVAAIYGALTRTQPSRSRILYTQVRAGSF